MPHFKGCNIIVQESIPAIPEPGYKDRPVHCGQVGYWGDEVYCDPCQLKQQADLLEAHIEGEK